MRADEHAGNGSAVVASASNIREEATQSGSNALAHWEAPAGKLGALLRGSSRLRQLQVQRRGLLRLQFQLGLRHGDDRGR